MGNLITKYKSFLEAFEKNNRIATANIGNIDKQLIEDLAIYIEDGGWIAYPYTVGYSENLDGYDITIPDDEYNFILYPNRSYHPIYIIQMSENDSSGEEVLEEFIEFIENVKQLLNADDCQIFNNDDYEEIDLNDIESMDGQINTSYVTTTDIRLYFSFDETISFDSSEILDYFGINYDSSYNGNAYAEYYVLDFIDLFTNDNYVPYEEYEYYDDYPESEGFYSSYEDYIDEAVDYAMKNLEDNYLTPIKINDKYYKIEATDEIFDFISNGIWNKNNKSNKTDIPTMYYNNFKKEKATLTQIILDILS